jgi:hypothetical protein
MSDLDAIIPYGKVLYPTAKQFADFTSYVNTVVKAENNGINGFVKVA